MKNGKDLQTFMWKNKIQNNLEFWWEANLFDSESNRENFLPWLMQVLLQMRAEKFKVQAKSCELEISKTYKVLSIIDSYVSCIGANSFTRWSDFAVLSIL